MNSAVPTAQTRARMLAAHGHARAALGVELDARGQSGGAWGWQGRTLGLPVSTDQTAAWLRVASDPWHYDTFWWNGTTEAVALPDSLPRPRHRASYQWGDGGWRYRADLFDRAPASVSTTLVLQHDPVLPAAWWSQLRGALDSLASTETERLAVQPTRLNKEMRRLLGYRTGTNSPLPWATCHGDLHFGNLCAPNLLILDWEGWGLAPLGYDAARLYLTSLLRPVTAARVRAELSAHLDSPAGRFAEFVVITELLNSPNAADLTEALVYRARQLLRISTPNSSPASSWSPRAPSPNG